MRGVPNHLPEFRCYVQQPAGGMTGTATSTAFASPASGASLRSTPAGLSNLLCFVAACYGVKASVCNDSGDVLPVGRVVIYHGADSRLVHVLRASLASASSSDDSQMEFIFAALLGALRPLVRSLKKPFRKP